MPSDRADRLADAFEAVVSAEGDERRRVLDEHCRADPEIAAELRKLVAADEANPEPEDESPLLPVASAAISDEPFKPGDRVGSCVIRRRIAKGGMSVVYEAVQEGPNRRVALKVMRRGLSEGDSKRFQLEMRVLARLKHEAVAQIYEVGVHHAPDGEIPYFVMELVHRGRSITDAARGMPLRQRLQLFSTVCRAIHHAHQRAVIHRDIKPANILVDDEDRPKVLDFGIASTMDNQLAGTVDPTERVGFVAGTWEYMSPEQCDVDRADIDTRADVYALGVLLYEMLADKRPLRFNPDEQTPIESARIVREEPRTPIGEVVPGLHADLRAIVGKAIAIDRDARYQQASELADDIDRHLRREPVSARRAGAMRRLLMFVRRNPAPSVSLMLLGVVLLAFAMVSTVLWRRAQTNFAVAEEQRVVLERERAELQEANEALDEQRRTANAIREILVDILEEGNQPRAGTLNPPTVIEAVEDYLARRSGRVSEFPAAEAVVRVALARAYRNQAKYDDAAREYRRAIGLWSDAGPRFLDSAQWARLGLIDVHLDSGNDEEAEALSRVVVTIDGQNAGGAGVNIRLARAQIALAQAQLGLGRPEAAWRAIEAAGPLIEGMERGAAEALRMRYERVRDELEFAQGRG